MDGKTKDTVEATAKPASPAPGVPHAPAATGRDEVQCCGCLSLRDGTVAIGVLYLVISLIFEAFLIYVVSHRNIRDIRVLLIVSFVFVSISTIAAILLLFGVLKNRHGFILPWIIWEVICIGLGLVSSVVSIFITGPSALIVLLTATIRMYFLYVVFVFRKELMAQAVNRQAMC